MNKIQNIKAKSNENGNTKENNNNINFKNNI